MMAMDMAITGRFMKILPFIRSQNLGIQNSKFFSLLVFLIYIIFYIFYFLAFFDHAGAFADDFFAAVEAACYDVLLAVCLGHDAYDLAMCNAVFVYDEHFVLVLQLYSGGGGNDDYVFVFGGEDYIAGRTGM
jgi:hypothetical protein